MPADLSGVPTEHLQAMRERLEGDYTGLASKLEDCLADLLLITEELARRGVHT